MNQKGTSLIYHSVNNSLYFESEDVGILVDGLWSSEYIEGMTPFGKKQEEDLLENVQPPQILAFTHHHPDHYDRARAEAYLSSHPGTVILEDRDLEAGPFRITSFRCRHSGYEKSERYRIDHRVFKISCRDFSALVAGDAELDEMQVRKILEASGCPDLLFCNPLQLAKKEKRDVIAGFQAKKIFMVHLPEDRDDYYHMQKLAEQISRTEINGVYPEAAGLYSQVRYT